MPRRRGGVRELPQEGGEGLQRDSGLSQLMRASRWVALVVLLATLAPLHQNPVAVAAEAVLTVPSQPCASMSTAHGSALSLMTAGVSQTFSITARDSAGMSIQGSSGATFVARLSQAQLSRTSVVPSSDDSSLFEGSARTSAAGPDVLSVRLARCGGLYASYYDDTWFGVGVASGVDTLLIADAASPDSWVHESFIGSVKWSGFIRPPVSGVYTFSAAASGAASVSLRGQTVIEFPLDSSGAAGSKTVSGTIQVPLPPKPNPTRACPRQLPTPY